MRRRGAARNALFALGTTRGSALLRTPVRPSGDALGIGFDNSTKVPYSGSTLLPTAPSRRIVHADALAWLDDNPSEPGTSVITSVPDLSEVPGLDLEGWRRWSIATMRRVIEWLPADGVAIFYQSDIRRGGEWIDKGYLVMRAIEDAGASLAWHKIVCRKPPGTLSLGRASYSHMLCAAPAPRPAPTRPSPDVLADAGFMAWSKAMGVEACRFACEYLRDETTARTVVDPFCGHGTALAVANDLGFDAIGVDLSARRCSAARKLKIDLSAGREPTP